MSQSIMAVADLATPMSVRVAATLGLAERAGDDGATAEQLATETGCGAPAVRVLLDHRVTAGVFDHETDTDLYRPTDLGAQMTEDAPDGVKPLLDINAAGGRAELAFVELLATVTTGSPAYARRYGRDFWADLNVDPMLRRTFDAQMNWRFQVEAPLIAERLDWSRFSTIVDVGGGDGMVLETILGLHPGVRGQVLDLAPTAAAATRRFAAAGLDDRAGAVSGSFFDAVPTGADAYVLSDILHDWDDDHARRILDVCRAAADPGGTVMVIEPVRGFGTGTATDLFMLMCFGGRERSVDELEQLALDSGLELRHAAPVTNQRMVLEFTVAPGSHRPG